MSSDSGNGTPTGQRRRYKMDSRLQQAYETNGRFAADEFRADGRDEYNYAVDYCEARFHGKSHEEAIAVAEANAAKFAKFPKRQSPKAPTGRDTHTGAGYLYK